MTLKDWILYIKDETGIVRWKVWKHKEHGDFVEINKDEKGWWTSKYQMGFDIPRKYFKSKSLAMKDVGKYMENN